LISGTTRLLALIGHPVEHSLSPRMHNAAFAADGLDFVYVCLDVDPDDLPAAVKGAAALKLRGFNITMPHKRAMISLLDELDEGARISGAVNTVVFDGDRAVGHNTDWSAFARSLEFGLPSVNRETVVLLGAGGAGSAVAHALMTSGVRELAVVDTDADLRSLGSHSSWWFHGNGRVFDEWLGLMQRDSIWKVIEEKSPIGFYVTQELT
jgi:shikimate dehydrogenase